MKPIFICAQPHDNYFIWQVDVMLTNFMEKGIQNAHILVYYPKSEERNIEWNKLIKKYKWAKFFFYTDIGDGVNTALYIPQLRPHILKQHFLKFQEDLKDHTFFYHDCDIIFNYLPNFDLLCDGPVCWQSDTSGYTDYSYFRSKELQGNIEEEMVIKELEKIGGLKEGTIKKYDKKTGGAQYVLKNINFIFWAEVEDLCIKIRKYLMEDVNKKYFKSENDGFQSWCADMWAVNFSLWKRDIVTDITRELDFSWATDPIDVFDKKPIFHNAGATVHSRNLFYKGAWLHSSPIGKALRVSKSFASYRYVEAIQKVKNG